LELATPYSKACFFIPFYLVDWLHGLSWQTITCADASHVTIFFPVLKLLTRCPRLSRMGNVCRHSQTQPSHFSIYEQKAKQKLGLLPLQRYERVIFSVRPFCLSPIWTHSKRLILLTSLKDGVSLHWRPFSWMEKIAVRLSGRTAKLVEWLAWQGTFYEFSSCFKMFHVSFFFERWSNFNFCRTVKQYGGEARSIGRESLHFSGSAKRLDWVVKHLDSMYIYTHIICRLLDLVWLQPS